ncbi:MAG: fasciclin domain-containing protein [Mycobacterium sp.]
MRKRQQPGQRRPCCGIVVAGVAPHVQVDLLGGLLALNGGQFTLFAPVDDAFAKLPSATIDSLKTDSAGLTNILPYHLVPGRVNPQNVDGVHKTLQGADLTSRGSPPT